jgi:hypothetical protein
MSESGHVFITRGDITKLRCDAWLLPTDASLHVTSAWVNAAKPTKAQLPFRKPKLWDENHRAEAIAPWHPARSESPAPIPVLTNSGGTSETPMSWYAEGIRQFVDVGKKVASQHSKWRQLPLLAVPFLGAGAGGKHHVAGSHMRKLLKILQNLAVDVDIVLVLAKDAQYSAAQSQRDSGSGTELSVRLRELGDRLALIAKRGDLVLFFGAGISRPAGLPLWRELLDLLGESAGLSSDEREMLSAVSVLDAASIIDGRMPEGELKTSIARQFSTVIYGLGHALSASLGVREAVTTNYDTLYEAAYRDCGKSISILPHAPIAEANAWLLKCHGCVTRAEDIVITRRDYLRYDSTRSALFGIVQAMLITRHILFLGFSLTDDNFYGLIDAVRRAIDGDRGLEPPRKQFGTAVLQTARPFVDELWKRDLDIATTLEAGESDVLIGSRRLELFLDYLAHKSFDASTHLLDENYASGLSADEKGVKKALQALQRALPVDASRSDFSRLRDILSEYGAVESVHPAISGTAKRKTPVRRISP